MDDVAWAPKAGLLHMEVLGDLSVFDPETNRAVALNRTAFDILALADGRTGSREMADVLAAAYGVRAEDIAADVRSGLDTLVEAGVLQASDG